MKERVFRRKIYDRLLSWKNEENGRTALLIEGARRIGKSTIVEHFAQKEYETYLLIDFSKAPESVLRLWDDVSDLNRIFTALQLTYHVQLHAGHSLIIFDEVQKCPRARQAIKWLVADGRFHYIETGSLLSIKRKSRRPHGTDDNILIPSEEERIQMYPMDYEEFRWALGDTATIPMLRQALSDWTPLGEDVNRRLMRDFRLYMLVGGMPQAVNTYLDTFDFMRVDRVKRTILQLYDEDFYDLDTSGKTSMMFRAIPAQLNSNASRYQVSSVIEGSRVERLQDQVAILKDSMTSIVATHSNDPSAGLSLHQNPNQFKLYCADTGLFVTLAFWDSDFTENTIYEKLLGDKLAADLGYVYENVVAQMLTAAGSRLYYHTWVAENGRHKYEVDFLLTRKSKICPIEVKSSQSKEHPSIDAFQKKYSSHILSRYMLYTKDFKKEQDLICLPVYMAGLI